MTFQDGEWLEGFFEKGVLHGFSRHYERKCHGHRLSTFGYYHNGIPFGIWYKLIDGGGAIVGPVDDEGQLSGPDITYLYPDCQTALMGQFEDGELKQAQAVTLKCVVEENNMMIPLFSEPQGSMYAREVSELHRMTTTPLLPDPYEQEWVQVQSSTVVGANEGLFARKDVTEGTILAFYNGIRRDPKTSYDEPDWVVNAYKIFDPTRKKGSLDIPHEYINTSNYCASLAHKTNHSFLPSAEFEVFDHPRFGPVPCLMATADIQAGEEIFVHYCYELDKCPSWYAEAWKFQNYPVPDAYKEWHALSMADANSAEE